ncbi:hypothetical protein [Trichococcus shcherbakoviae]|uniref:Uncharacterized protein n=1 Tax=Trichococcus shcherbakoviae TaxID=2094020 RepID=A0A383TFI1_9LACT|nr:hypothetical protein [Trichococcus shcherbakoviae]SYZ78201.1 Hypothetical protein TART1_0982 [Trichococcus shcherbakoviae]
MAPGPPTLMATATPTMLPVPIVPASAVQTAWKVVIVPTSISFGFRNTVFSVLAITVPKRVKMTALVLKVRYSPVPSIRTSIGIPQMIVSLSHFTISILIASFVGVPAGTISASAEG